MIVKEEVETSSVNKIGGTNNIYKKRYRYKIILDGNTSSFFFTILVDIHGPLPRVPSPSY